MLEYINALPLQWKYVFETEDFTERKKRTLELWNKYCSEELSLTISFINHNLLSLDLINDNGELAVIYGLKNEQDKKIYYKGFIPKETYNIEYWKDIPESIAKFYTNIHNGFVDLQFDDPGIIPIDKVECLDDYEWGIIEDLGLEVQINLSSMYILFSNGAGGYVVMDITNCDENNATIWFAKKEPMYNKKFWDFTDEWMLMTLMG